jgi:hypothetical protein
MAYVFIIGPALAIGCFFWRLASRSVHLTLVPQCDGRSLWLSITIMAPHPMSVVRVEVINLRSNCSRSQSSLGSYKFPFPLEAGQTLPGRIILATSPDQFGMWNRGRTIVRVYGGNQGAPFHRTIRIPQTLAPHTHMPAYLPTGNQAGTRSSEQPS